MSRKKILIAGLLAFFSSQSAWALPQEEAITSIFDRRLDRDRVGKGDLKRLRDHIKANRLPLLPDSHSDWKWQFLGSYKNQGQTHNVKARINYANTIEIALDRPFSREFISLRDDGILYQYKITPRAGSKLKGLESWPMDRNSALEKRNFGYKQASSLVIQLIKVFKIK